MLGISGSAAFSYSSGVFLLPIVGEFGWTRAEFSGAFTLQMTVALFVMPLVGRLVDKVGPRKLALGGIAPFVLGLSVLGLASGQVWQWWALCVFQGLCSAFIVPTVWMAAVVGRFDKSRGLAMAIALAGISLGSAIWPVLGAYYVENFGWRQAYLAMALTWAVPIVPLTFLAFHGARDLDDNTAAPLRLPSIWPSLRTGGFIFLALAGLIFASMSFGLTMYFVPLLQDRGLPREVAAWMAGLIGLAAIAGRVGMGFLLDRLPTRPMAVAVFLLPALVATILLIGADSRAAIICAAVVLGLAQGAEIDLITYITARQFGITLFGSIYSILLGFVSVGASLGPLIAGSLFDMRGDYDGFLQLIAGAVIVAAILVGLATASKTASTATAACES